MSQGKKGIFGRLVAGLSKTRNNIVAGIDSIFSGFSAIDDDFYEEIEETLIMGDIGIHATEAIIEDLKAKVKEQKIKEPSECKALLIDTIKRLPQLGNRGTFLIQLMRDKLVEHRQYITAHGEDMPEIREWRWPRAFS